MLVRLLAARKNLFHDNRVAKCDVTVRQTPHVISDSPGIMNFFVAKLKKAV